MQAEAKIAPEELFALTDEQILEIEPVEQDVEHRAEDANANSQTQDKTKADSSPSLGMTAVTTASAEPPEWLAQRMRDPWKGTEAREFWEGVQREQQEASAYREVFAKPEEARAAAERARMLDEFDSAYFGAPGKPAEELSASRAQLAQRMMREDPTAFREMVLAGLRALEEVEKSAPSGRDPAASPAGTQSSNTSENAQRELAGRYAAFEKAANDDLERSVGVVIDRTLQQALPNSEKANNSALKSRLNATIRQEIEKSLQGDQQLGEQVSRLLAPRKFDDAARAQVVRLISERAAQLVPGAAKRVLGDWTQTAMASHRTRSQRDHETASRKDLTPAGRASAASGSENNRPQQKRDSAKPRGVDYRKFSDEQILEM
jgi:hypothetical protein